MSIRGRLNELSVDGEKKTMYTVEYIPSFKWKDWVLIYICICTTDTLIYACLFTDYLKKNPCETLKWLQLWKRTTGPKVRCFHWCSKIFYKFMYYIKYKYRLIHPFIYTHTHSKKAELISTAKTSEKRYIGAEGKEAGVYWYSNGETG